jgi:4-hydroxythreonine-4-phosphate dehydrogenase
VAKPKTEALTPVPSLPLAVTLGDPAGVGAEVVGKALAALDVPVWLFGSRRHAGSVPPVARFIDVGDATGIEPGTISAAAGRIALDSIDAAVTAVERGECSALVTAPIHKQSIAAAGSPFPGHTELLAARAGLARYGYDYAMFFDSPSIKTVLLTVHVPLKDAIASIDPGTIAALAGLTDREYARLYGKRPRIAAAAINPHGGEGGRFGTEEERIRHGVDTARSEGIEIDGPFPADTIFRAKYDVVMAMYHDQGLIPVKTMEFDRSVNVTLGLPYLRASVDHGTAFEIAGKGVADAGPMRYAIEWTARQAARWSR